MVVENGCGSPCIDLRQVSSELAAAAKDADLVRGLFFLFFLQHYFAYMSTNEKHILIEFFVICR